MVDAVMLATLDELAAHGVARLSVERIATACEVNKTSIYRRWPTREALIAGAMEYVLLDFENTLPDTGTLRGDLLALGQTLVSFLESAGGLALARAAIAESESAALAGLAARQLASGAHAPVVALVERAVARGEWNPRRRPDAAFGMLVGAVLHRRLFEHQPADSEWLGNVVDVLAGGLSAKT